MPSHSRRWRATRIVVILFALVITLTACLSSDPTQPPPAPTQSARTSSVALPALPTATYTPAPTATPTEVPTDTPTPTPAPPTETPTETPTPTLEPAAIPWSTPGADECPLTGLPVENLALLERRPLAIKIQNAGISRPQYGLPEADIVYEHLSEAAITRFTGIYLCQQVTKIGSTRSARFIDLEIPAMYDSLMAFSGTSAGLYPKFLNADFYDRQFCYGWGLHPEGFYRDQELRAQGIPIEHTLFADPAKIWEIADELGINERQDLSELHFSADPPEGGQPATHINIPYPSRDMIVDYRYDPDLGTYLRWDGGSPHVDAASGKQIQVTNVVVVYANHVDTDIYEDEPRRNHPSVQIQLWGTGPVVVFRDGLAYEGLWARPQRDHMLVFRDPEGQLPIPLKPGNTWIQLVPLPGHRWTFEATWDAEE
ncbi:MAG: DUF3048 domain-containing protein [Anaerolineae bacterium]|nr:DUF3048 domain-containing protein [Anaerolineae bacterium]